MIDRHGAKTGYVDTKRMQVLKRLTTQELSANLMPRCGLTFDERNAMSFARQRDRSSTTCHTTTEDENFVLQGTPISTGGLMGSKLFRAPTLNAIAVKETLHDDAVIAWRRNA